MSFNRLQFVNYNGHCSSTKIITCGVAQGSILDLSFLLYINDICNVSNALEQILFAGDTNVFFSRNDPYYFMNYTFNFELSKEWFIEVVVLAHVTSRHGKIY